MNRRNNKTLLTLLLHVWLVATLACGGQDETHGGLPLCAETHEITQDPVGLAHLEADGSLRFEPYDAAASQDKAFGWLKEGQAPVFVPTAYGDYTGGYNGRCAGDISTWPYNCRIPQNRRIWIEMDAESCEAISVPYSYPLVDAVFEWMLYMRQYHGWDVVIGSGQPFNAQGTVRCGNAGGAAGAMYRATASCWDLPGSPRDLCFGANTFAVEINLAALLTQSYDALVRGNLIRNTVWHELGHLAGLGHVMDTARLMNNGLSSAFGAGFMTYHTTYETVAMTDFNRDIVACNWQSGDPVGDSCPHEG